jgi:hypothetical protein
MASGTAFVVVGATEREWFAMLKTRALAVVAGLLSAVISAPGMAQETGRYEARVEVPNQSPSARREVLDDALSVVLRRVTGDPDAPRRSEAQSLLSRPGDFLQRFSYQRVSADQTDAEGGEANQPEQQLMLMARFDGDSVRQALIEAGVAVWQRDVPPVLAWVAIEDAAGERTLVGSEKGDRWRQVLLGVAADLGVELTFPLLDLEDQRQVRFSDVAGGFPGPVLSASQRYDAAVILMGSLRSDGSQWRSRWRLLGPGEQRANWRDVHSDKGSALTAWRRQLAARLRESYTVLPDPESSDSMLVRFSGVTKAEDFAWVQRTLAEASGVSEVTLRRLSSDKLQFALRVNVERARVIRGLDRNPNLDRADSAGGSANGVPAAGPMYRVTR